MSLSWDELKPKIRSQCEMIAAYVDAGALDAAITFSNNMAATLRGMALEEETAEARYERIGPHLIWQVYLGKVIIVSPLTYGQAQITRGEAWDRTGHDEQWMYATIAEAALAYCQWCCSTDEAPQGWTRYTNRLTGIMLRRNDQGEVYEDKGA